VLIDRGFDVNVASRITHGRVGGRGLFVEDRHCSLRAFGQSYVLFYTDLIAQCA